MFKQMLLAGVALVIATGTASAKDLKAIGFSVGTARQHIFLDHGEGRRGQSQGDQPQRQGHGRYFDYDLVKQSNQLDNFVAAGVDLILLSAADSKSIAPAIKRAQAAGIVVVAVDVIATGADAAVLTNNAQAGELPASTSSTSWAPTAARS